MVAPDVDFKDFVDRVREKFGLRVRFKLKVRDEGDLITMADGDDWEMAVQNVKKEVALGEGDMGKMEVRTQPFTFSSEPSNVAAGRYINSTVAGMDPRGPRITALLYVINDHAVPR